MKLQVIENLIYEIRGQKVMLDFDLAKMYGIETKKLKQSVKRNLNRFPKDFLFELNNQEVTTLRSQIVTSNKRGGTRYSPFAFTEQGVAMLSSILNSERAIEINIAIMRAFVFVRQYALTHKDLTEKLRQLEDKYDQKFLNFEQAINYLLEKDKIEVAQKDREMIGFKIPEKSKVSNSKKNNL